MHKFLYYFKFRRESGGQKMFSKTTQNRPFPAKITRPENALIFSKPALKKQNLSQKLYDLKKRSELEFLISLG